MLFAVDTETTGLKDARPIEIAAVCVDDFSIAFCERIKPDIPIEAGAIAVHGITAKSLASCRTEKEVMQDFVTFIARHGAKTIVAHNAAFDQSVIAKAMDRAAIPSLGLPWACTLEMSRAKFAARGSKHKLSDCCARAGIEYKDAHCALSDAIMCARVFKSFFEPTLEEMRMDAGLAAVNAEEAAEFP